MPRVAISSVTPSWFTSLRSTSRSTSQANATMIAAASRKASHSGIRSASRAAASAANSTIAPCAKLNTPEALKISTKPSATSAYSTPAIRPPISTSSQKPGAVPDCASGRTIPIASSASRIVTGRLRALIAVPQCEVPR